MPFKSDAQRKYLWSQKPEVAKKFAQHHSDGGWVDTWTQRLKHADPVSEPGTVRNFLQTAWDMMQKNKETETPQAQAVQAMQKYEPPKPESRWSADWNVPIGHALGADWNTYGSYQDMSEGSDPWSAGIKGTWRFNEGGDVPMPMDREVKKLTQKDRYGNQVTYEFAEDVKPIDQTEIIKELMKNMGEVPEMEVHTSTPMMDHPGEPKGTDTVPAWLTPGEFVVNKEATEIYGDEIKKMNDHGREIQKANKGMEVKGYAGGGGVDLPLPPADNHSVMLGPAAVLPWLGVGLGALGTGLTAWDILNRDKEIREIPDYGATGPELYRNEGGWITDQLLDRLAEVESGNNNKAVSKAGAVGKYQWLPKSAKQAGYGVKAFDPLDETAAREATKNYLMGMQKHHGFTPEETLRAYNWGPGNVIKHKKGIRKDIPDEALNYPGKILGFDKVEGVPAPANMVLPTARPEGLGGPDALPTPRPEQKAELPAWQQFMNKYILGDKTQYAYDGGQIPHFDTLASEYQKPEGHTIHPEIKTGGHQMFGGNQNLAGEPVVQGPPEKEIPWYNELLGPKLKDESTLTDADKEFLDKSTSESELLAADQLAEEENQIAGPNEIESVEDAIIESVQNESVNNNIHAEEIKTEAMKNDDVKNEVKKDIVKKVDEQTKNAGEIDADDKTIETAAKKDPGTVKKAEGFLKGILGDLFDTKELKRAAVMYAGSRLLGYGHQGSLRHIMKNYVGRIDAKAANRDAFIKSNAKNYTAASLQQYKETGDLTSLVPVGTPANRTGEFKTFYGPNGAVKAEKIKIGKSSGWSTDGGKTFIDGTKFNSDPAYIKGTSENKTMVNNFISRTTDQLKSLRGQFDRYEVDDNVGYKTDINPATSSGKIAEWAVKNGVKPEQLSGLVESAYHDAINDQRQDGSRARSLVPYLNQLVVRQKVGNPDLFLAKGYDPEDKGAKQFVNAQKLQTLNNSISHVMKAKGLQGGTQDLANQFYNAAVRDWNKLSTKEQESYIGKALDDESGFYKFVEEQALKYAQ